VAPNTTESDQSPLTMTFHDKQNATLDWTNETLELTRLFWSYGDNLDQLAGQWLIATVTPAGEVTATVSNIAVNNDLATITDNTDQEIGMITLANGNLTLELASSDDELPVLVPETKRFYAGSRDGGTDSILAVRVDDLPLVMINDVVTDSSVWLINTTVVNDSGQAVVVNVSAVETTTIDGIEYTSVTASGIPDYAVTISQNQIDALNARPNGATDFITGQTTATAGQIIQFGDDIGYNSNSNCGTNEGFGYWPPGPDCPDDTNKTGNFPVNPEPGSEPCATGLGVIGYFVNGVSVFDWGDGQSYEGNGVKSMI